MQSYEFFSARVENVVLSKGNLLSKEITKLPQGSHKSIGDIKFEFMGVNPDPGFHYAKPFNNHIKYYPLKNEVVLVVKLPSDEMYKSLGNDHWYYFPAPIAIWKNENHNASPKQSTNFRELYQPPIETYLETEGGISNAGDNDDDDPLSDLNIDLGTYFNEKSIKGLKPFEGDFLLEGRFGNSIRMGYTNRPKENYWSSNIEDIGDPITIISNGLPNDPLIYKNNNIEDDDINSYWFQTVENINEDPSSIYLTSNQKIYNFNLN